MKTKGSHDPERFCPGLRGPLHISVHHEAYEPLHFIEKPARLRYNTGNAIEGRRTMKKLLAVFAILSVLILCGFAEASADEAPRLAYRYAEKDEGRALMLSNQAFFDGFNQNDLDFRMQKQGASMDEYLTFAAEQVLDFTEEEKALIDACFALMEDTLRENAYTLPPIGEIVLIKTTMLEEAEAGAYTHGTQIYLGDDLLNTARGIYKDDGILKEAKLTDEQAARRVEHFRRVLWHELFHCLTRYNPDFRADMYSLIHFTVAATEYPLPPSVSEYLISNPDVGHHNAWATFRIDGQDLDCFAAFVTLKHFEEEGDWFFDSGTTALVPVDGRDVWYAPEEAENFDEVFGMNTGYVIDPEECMADNFADAMLFGMDGPDGDGYPSPEIIEGVLGYLKAA